MANILCAFFLLRNICNINFFLKILRGRVKAAKTPPFSGGVNTGLTQQEKEFQAFIVWIVIGPTIRSRIGVCDTLCGVRCCSEKGSPAWGAGNRGEARVDPMGAEKIEDTQGAERIWGQHRLEDTLGAIKWLGMWMSIGRLAWAPRCHRSPQCTVPSWSP